MDDSVNDRSRLTVTIRADLVDWLRAKSKWQQRSMSSIVEDGLIDLREKMGEPGTPSSWTASLSRPSGISPACASGTAADAEPAERASTGK